MKSRHTAYGTLVALSFLLLEIGLAWAQSETELIRGAKQEGKVMFWSAMRNEDNQALVEGFEAKYPFVKVDVLRARSEQLVNRAVIESLAGKATADV